MKQLKEELGSFDDKEDNSPTGSAITIEVDFNNFKHNEKTFTDNSEDILDKRDNSKSWVVQDMKQEEATPISKESTTFNDEVIEHAFKNRFKFEDRLK